VPEDKYGRTLDGKLPKKQTIRDKETKSAVYHLTPQELRFVQAVAQGADHTAAIKLAGYRGDGSRGRVRAWRLMQKPVIRAAIYELMCQAFDKSSIEVTQWLREVATIAFMPADMMDGKPKWSDKGKMLTVIGEFQKLLEKTAPGKQPSSIINLIVQAGATVGVAAVPKEPVAVQLAAVPQVSEP
jgi:hypothetical protein